MKCPLGSLFGWYGLSAVKASDLSDLFGLDVDQETDQLRTTLTWVSFLHLPPTSFRVPAMKMSYAIVTARIASSDMG